VTSTAPVELDLDAVAAWLGTRIQLTGPLTAQRLGGGQSNLSYRIHDGQRCLVLRRPPLGEVLKGAHDVVREYRLLAGLSRTGLPLVETVAVCEDDDVIGAPFSVVGCVDGFTLRSADDLVQLTTAGRRNVVADFAGTLARLHAVPPELSGSPVERGWDFAARQLHVWRRQLNTPGRSLPLMDELADRLAAAVPTQHRVAIVHGDYRLDNVLLGADGEVRAVIDWELWTLGDPVAELGIAIAYWGDSPFEPAPLGQTPTGQGDLGSRQDFLAAYEEAGGVVPDGPVLRWHIALGLWRFAAILEGVYRRNVAGAYGEGSAGEWRRFEHMVPVMAQTASQVLDSAL
jgi:aminoglycoside phosphotransferase (APT) family kinase protein